MSLEKPLDHAGKARGVTCDAWSEQSRSEPARPGMAAWAEAGRRGGKREQEQVVLRVTVRGCKQQGTRLFF